MQCSWLTKAQKVANQRERNSLCAEPLMLEDQVILPFAKIKLQISSNAIMKCKLRKLQYIGYNMYEKAAKVNI